MATISDLMTLAVLIVQRNTSTTNDQAMHCHTSLAFKARPWCYACVAPLAAYASPGIFERL